MQLWLTVVAPDAAGSVELRLSGPTGSTVADLRVALGSIELFGQPARVIDDLSCGGRRLLDAEPLGYPPLLDGAVVSLGGQPPPGRDRAEGLLTLAVTGGPDCGRTVRLGLGRHTVGRGAGADIPIDDPDLSRRQLLVEVRANAVEVTGLRTTNGSTLDGVPLAGSAQRWPAGARLRAGATTLELFRHGSPSAATTFDGEGHLGVNRQPRPSTPRVDIEVHCPAAPEPRHRGRLPVLTMLIPLLLAVPMAWLQRSPAYLLFGAMSPAMMLGSFLGERRGGRRDERKRRAEWQAATSRARTELDRALAAEAIARRRALPDPAELLETVRTPLARVWERRPTDTDFLRLRIGLGGLPADVRVTGADPPSAPIRVDDVPVGVSLPAVGVLGLAGPRPAVLGLARHLVAQVTGWHSPRDVGLMVLTAHPGGLDHWRWAARSPHGRPDDRADCYAWVGDLARPEQLRQRTAELLAILDDRLAQRDHPAPDRRRPPSVVVVLDGARALRHVPGIARLLAEGPAVGILAVCIDDHRSRLPVECLGVIEFPDFPDPAGAAVAATGLPDVTPDAAVCVDGVSADWAERFGRAVARLRDTTPSAASASPPEHARLVDLLDFDPADPLTLADRWRAAPRSTVAVVGATADAAYAIDLRHDGPHVLIGGTTGSGKSELLQTLITSLALVNSPDQLGFVLVDYKGGSAFDACAELPHTLGLVTDLDPHLPERALTSLGAELTRRETLLRRAGAKDLDDYLRRVGPAAPALPRLVLVIDEFRMLAEELPSFLDGLVRIGAVGRSLGVHLILATQRPAGVVSADMAANVNLRIALRVRDQADSEDVIESREAAAISPRTPGRALARSATTPLVLFQTARVTETGRDPAQTLCLELLTADRLGESRTPTPTLVDPVTHESDLRRVVRATRAAAGALGRPASHRPWLPPLPSVVTLDELATDAAGWRVPYAVVDRPDRQAQESVAWDLEQDTHLLVAGSLRSGRSTCLRTLAGALSAALGPDRVHLHGIDGGAGSLRPLSALPQSGVIAAGDEVARGVLLLDRLAAEVAARQSLLSAAGFSALAEQHAHSRPQDRLPYLVLLLDGWESLAAAWEQVEHGRPIETLLALMRDGGAVGLRVAVTGDRSLLMSRVAALVRDKIVLRLADPSDLLLVGVPVAALPRDLPPGRGVRVSDHTEVQVASLSPDPSGPGQAAALGRIARRAAARPAPEPLADHQRPLRIEALPRRIDYAEAAAGADRSARGWALVGVGGDAGTPMGLQLPGPALVAGPPRSGRSTTLATIARWLQGQSTPVVAVAETAGRLGEIAVECGGQVVAPDDAERLGRLLDEHPQACVLVDDVERIAESELEDVALQWFNRPGSRGGGLVVAGSSAELPLAFRGLSVVARRSGQGVLLSPASYADGELLGIRTPPGPAALIPGRGLLVQAGRATPIQVAQ